MARKDIITMSVKESKRLKVIAKVIDGEMTRVEATEILELSDREIRRIVRRVRKEGDVGITHRSRGKPSPQGYTGGCKSKGLIPLRKEI